MLAALRLIAFAAFAALSWLPASHAQAPAAAKAPAQPQPPLFKPEEIEQLVAPIALYPDPLVAQILMASTYPLEVVSAARWAKSNPGLKGKQLDDAMQLVPWDPSVKSLTAFPQVLSMMDQKLDMTQKLGDAFLAQQKDVMDAIQRLRAKADAASNLKSSKEQTVAKEQNGGNTYITIEPANPEVVYVPAYNPTVVYGTWPYPAYPPYAYYPPGYVPGAALFAFGLGVAIANNWGGGNCDWHGGDVNINNNVNRNTNINRGDRGQGGRGEGGRGQGGTKWNHSPEHRQGAGYRDQGSRDKFGGGQQRPGVDSRESFRGRAEQGRQEIARSGGADRMAGSGGRGEVGGRGGASQQPAGGFGGGNRGDIGGGNRGDIGGGNRGGFSGGGDRGGFGGVGGGGAQTRDFSNRGASSRQNSSFGGGGGSRGSFSGGGGGRGGGGGGGGRGGGGGGRGGGGRR